MRCSNNLKQISLAMHNYDALHGHVPRATVGNPGLPASERLSWAVEVLPYVEQEALFSQFDLSEGWDAPHNAGLGSSEVPIFRCPDWEREYDPAQPSWTAYVGCSGVGADSAELPAGHPRAGFFGHERTLTLDGVKDGLAYTMTVMESGRDNGPWSRGGRSTLREFVERERPYVGFGRPLGGTHFEENSLFGRGDSIGMQAAMCDGSVRLFPDHTDPSVLEAHATTHGAEQDDGGSSDH